MPNLPSRNKNSAIALENCKNSALELSAQCSVLVIFINLLQILFDWLQSLSFLWIFNDQIVTCFLQCAVCLEQQLWQIWQVQQIRQVLMILILLRLYILLNSFSCKYCALNKITLKHSCDLIISIHSPPLLNFKGRGGS